MLATTCVDHRPLPKDLTGERASTPATMVSRIRRGDKRAEAEFCRRYYGPVLRLLRRYTRDAARAEDITHEVLIKVLVRLRISGIDRPECLDRFVLQTAKFSWLGWLRQSDNQVELHESMEEKVELQDDTERALVSQERRDIMALLIDSLRVPRDRELLYRCYLCDESKQSICDALRLTATHFDRVISRARKRLRRLAQSQNNDILMALDAPLEAGGGSPEGCPDDHAGGSFPATGDH